MNALIHTTLYVHRALFGATVPVKGHVGVAPHEIHLIKQAVDEHARQGFVWKADLSARHVRAQVKDTNSNGVHACSFERCRQGLLGDLVTHRNWILENREAGSSLG